MCKNKSPGKFEESGCLGEALYEVVQDGFADETFSTSAGCVDFIQGPLRATPDMCSECAKDAAAFGFSMTESFDSPGETDAAIDAENFADDHR